MEKIYFASLQNMRTFAPDFTKKSTKRYTRSAKGNLGNSMNYRISVMVFAYIAWAYCIFLIQGYS